jgi:hypothetical protein
MQGAERELQDLLQRLDQVNLCQTENQREKRLGLTKIIHCQAVKLLHSSFWRHHYWRQIKEFFFCVASFNRPAENQIGTSKEKHRHKLSLPI